MNYIESRSYSFNTIKTSLYSKWNLTIAVTQHTSSDNWIIINQQIFVILNEIIMIFLPMPCPCWLCYGWCWYMWCFWSRWCSWSRCLSFTTSSLINNLRNKVDLKPIRFGNIKNYHQAQNHHVNHKPQFDNHGFPQTATVTFCSNYATEFVTSQYDLKYFFSEFWWGIFIAFEPKFP